MLSLGKFPQKHVLSPHSVAQVSLAVLFIFSLIYLNGFFINKVVGEIKFFVDNSILLQFKMYSNPNCGHMNVKSHKMSEELEEGEIVDETEVDGGGIEQLLAEYHKQIESREELKKSKKCFICRCITAKYNCPRCGIKSCSLKCCLQHKRQFNCSGVRDRLSFVPLDKYTDIQLNSGRL